MHGTEKPPKWETEVAIDVENVHCKNKNAKKRF